MRRIGTLAAVAATATPGPVARSGSSTADATVQLVDRSRDPEVVPVVPGVS